MLNVLRLDQDFGWPNFSNINVTTDVSIFDKLPHPKIVLLNDNKWFNYDRSNIDALIFWTSESLAFERAIGKPIVKLTDKDFIYSGSQGPNNNFNLLYWLMNFQTFYSNSRYKKFIPKNEIISNNILSTLGNSKLHRCYIFCKFIEQNLINKNISFGYGVQDYSVLPDVTNEIIGQEDMFNYVHLNRKLLPQQALKLDLDWRLLKTFNNYYDPKYTNIFPTNAYLDSSLVYVSETIVYNKEFFITEKTIKGLISGRPAIIIGTQHFLKHLKELGFKTYNEIIDESYDDVENLRDRIDLSVQIAKEFINSNILNYPKKLSKVQEITNHNLRILFETDWSRNINQAISNIANNLGVTLNK